MRSDQHIITPVHFHHHRFEDLGIALCLPWFGDLVDLQECGIRVIFEGPVICRFTNDHHAVTSCQGTGDQRTLRLLLPGFPQHTQRCRKRPALQPERHRLGCRNRGFHEQGAGPGSHHHGTGHYPGPDYLPGHGQCHARFIPCQRNALRQFHRSPATGGVRRHKSPRPAGVFIKSPRSVGTSGL